MQTTPRAVLFAALVAALSACGTKPDNTEGSETAIAGGLPAKGLTVTVSPANATVNACQALQLTATVRKGGVTWSVQEGSAGGSITSTGLYTAPATAGTYHAVATSTLDARKKATAAIAVAEKVVSITVAPVATELTAGKPAQFVATVTTTCGSFLSSMNAPAPATTVAAQ